MSNYTPRQLFADWYRNVDPEVTEEKVNTRLAAIDQIIKTKERDFWLDIVCLYLDIPLHRADNRHDFIDFFKQHDSTFPLIGNDALLKYLAAITLCIHLNESSGNNNVLSLSCITGGFFSKSKINDKVPVPKYAFDFIQASAQKRRREDNELENIAEPEVVKHIISSHLLLKEEVNVLWWLIGEFSQIVNSTFQDAGAVRMTLLGSKELSQITTTELGPSSFKSILHKMLITANGGKAIAKKVTGYDTILSLSKEERKLLCDISGNISIVTPMLFEVKKSIEHGNDEDWRSQGLIHLNKKMKLIEFCCQTYFEFLLLKLI
jgi:hypothetical protein